MTPCDPIRIGDLRGIVCIRRRRAAGTPQRCSACGARDSSRLCDYPVRPGKTCDAPLCDRCAVRVGRNRDHCPSHPRQGELAL